jgi:hypothetical protein
MCGIIAALPIENHMSDIGFTAARGQALGLAPEREVVAQALPVVDPKVDWLMVHCTPADVGHHSATAAR